MPGVCSLAANTALTAVANKTPSVSSLVRKKNYDAKISELEKKFLIKIMTNILLPQSLNTLAASVFNARLPQANLITRRDFDAILSSLSRKNTKNKSKLLFVENKLKRLTTFDLSYFTGKSHFEEDGTQNYLVFHIFKKLLVLVVLMTFITGNLKDFLTK